MKRTPVKPRWLFIGLSVLYISLFSTRFVLQEKANIVTQVFSHGTRLLFEGRTPYTNAESLVDVDAAVFKYSPIFAIIYKPFLAVPEDYRGLVWNLVSLCLFMLVFDLLLQSFFPSASRMALLASVLMLASDVDVSLRYQQSNVMMLALTLLGAVMFFRSAYWSSSFSFVAGVFFKLYPALWLATLLLKKPRFLLYCAASAAVFLVTSLFLLPNAWSRWCEWIPFALLPTTSAAGVLRGLPAFLDRYGFSEWKLFAQIVGACIGIGIAGVTLQTQSARKAVVWVLFTLGAYVCVFSHHIESPFFVFSNTSLVVLFLYAITEGHRRVAWGACAIWFFLMFLGPLLHTSLKLDGISGFFKLFGSLATLLLGLTQYQRLLRS